MSSQYTIDLHASAVKLAKTKTQTIAKKKVLSMKLTDEDVIRPEGARAAPASRAPPRARLAHSRSFSEVGRGACTSQDES